MSAPSDEPRLHVDSDWKAQAQAEKERLGKIDQERASKGGGRQSSELPPADFRSLIGILASQAMSGLGLYGDEQGRVVVDPVGSKFAIDLLGVLEEKTKGNLSKEEASDLESVLRELRMRFVQVIDLLARQDVRAGAATAGSIGVGEGAAADLRAASSETARASIGAPATPGAPGSAGAAPKAPPSAPGGSRIIVP